MTKIPGRIGPYTIHNELGRGGMSVVYRATDARNGRMVALKILPPEFTHNPNLVKRFVREAENAVRLRHPNIVHTYETGQADGFNFIAMELATGGTLADRVKRLGRAFTPEETASILGQVAAGLDYAHHLGFVHRDIKPSNIFFAEDGRALLADFGIAKALYADYSVYTGTGVAVGTPAYMSPEQALGNGDLDHRSDVYSLGVVAYMLLTGRVPFEADSQPALMRKIAYDPPPPAEQFNPRILPGTAYVLKCVLAKEPLERYASAGQFTAALTQSLFLSPQAQQSAPSPVGSGQRAVNPPIRLPVGSSQAARKTVITEKPQPAKIKERRSGLLISVVLVLSAIGLVWVIWQVGIPGISNNGERSPVAVETPLGGVVDGGGNGEGGSTPAEGENGEQIALAAPIVTETATATKVPTETATPVPTETETSTPTETPSATATAESEAAVAEATEDDPLTSTSTPSATVEPTATPRPPTSTPVSRFTPTRTPTSTRTPAPTRTVTPTRNPYLPATTPTPTPTATFVNTTATGIPTNYTFDLLSPADGDILQDGPVVFQWRTDIQLAPGQELELIVWPMSAGRERWKEDGRSPTGARPSSPTAPVWTAGFNLSSGPIVTANNTYYWGVALGHKNAQGNWEKLRLLNNTTRTFFYQSSGPTPAPEPPTPEPPTPEPPTPEPPAPEK